MNKITTSIIIIFTLSLTGCSQDVAQLAQNIKEIKESISKLKQQQKELQETVQKLELVIERDKNNLNSMFN